MWPPHPTPPCDSHCFGSVLCKCQHTLCPPPHHTPFRTIAACIVTDSHSFWLGRGSCWMAQGNCWFVVADAYHPSSWLGWSRMFWLLTQAAADSEYDPWLNKERQRSARAFEASFNVISMSFFKELLKCAVLRYHKAPGLPLQPLFDATKRCWKLDNLVLPSRVALHQLIPSYVLLKAAVALSSCFRTVIKKFPS